jgi:serine/threonine-protein kinase
MNKDLGRYLLTDNLGEGGMAAVYKGLDRHLNRTVAVKVILPGFQQSDIFLKRFEREARAVAQLSHPNIVSVIDYGSHEGSPYLVMEFIAGGTLKDHLRSPIPWQEAARKLLPVAQALQYAHSQGIIHRDIKPANILITQTGDFMLSDFGIAKTVSTEESTHLTSTGASVGTPAYMAPEQGMGQPVDQRADIYALGVVFYEMITGRIPFQADTPMAVMLKHVTEPLPPPHKFVPDLPEVVEGVLCKALAKQPIDRFQEMGEFVQAVDDLLRQDYHGQIAARSSHNTLANEATVLEKPTTQPPTQPPAVKPRPRNLWPWALGGSVVLCLLLAGVGLAGGLAYQFLSAAPTQEQPTLPVAALAIPATPLPASATSEPVQVILAASPTVEASPIASQTQLPPSATPLPTSTSTSTPLPTATPFGGGGLIAFQSDRAGGNDIYVMQGDGSGVTQLTFGIADDRAPAWSPDGREIAYQSNDGGDYEIHAISVPGGQDRQITRNECNDYSPVYSPDGRQLVYYSDCDGNREIYVVDVSGSNIRQLTKTDETYNWYPSWSPDGRLIAFSSNRSGAYQIYVMNADGSGLRSLTNGCVPFFSPDGSQIVFNQYCTDSGNVMLVNADGSEARSLTAAPFDNNRNPNWSADGTKIVFQSEQSGNFEIWIMDADGSNPQQLTNDAAFDAVPVWQPRDIR